MINLSTNQQISIVGISLYGFIFIISIILFFLSIIQKFGKKWISSIFMIFLLLSIICKY